jgi:hypothetical protein
MRLQQSLRWVATAFIGTIGGLGMLAMTSTAIAAGFDQVELDESERGDIILIASPAGQVGHQLLIVEQLTDERPCWEESGGRVTPLLLDFDFSGICRRTLDSNGYSLRMGHQDLGLNYTLRIVPQGDQLVLVASSARDFFAPPIELGRTAPGQNSGFAAIYLAPSWRLTRRAFEGQTLGHYYLTHDADIESYMAVAVRSGDYLVPPAGYRFPEPVPVTEPGVESTEEVIPTPGLEPSLPESGMPSGATLDGEPSDAASPDEIAPPLPSTIPAPTPETTVNPVPPIVPSPVPPAVVPSVPETTLDAPLEIEPSPSVTPAPPAPTNSPIPVLEAAPLVVPPAPTNGATLAPIQVPSPPPLSDATNLEPDPSLEPADSAPSPWIQFDRQPSTVQ